jgi:hypothetical protein
MTKLRNTNAVKSGLYSKNVCLPGERLKDFRRLRDRLNEEYPAHGVLEQVCQKDVARAIRLKERFEAMSEVVLSDNPLRQLDRCGRWQGSRRPQPTARGQAKGAPAPGKGPPARSSRANQKAARDFLSVATPCTSMGAAATTTTTTTTNAAPATPPPPTPRRALATPPAPTRSGAPVPLAAINYNGSAQEARDGFTS